MNLLAKFGIFLALAAVLSMLFALFPDRSPAGAAPHLPSAAKTHEVPATAK